MSVIKILAIGNSFSQDAAYYLHDMAIAGGIQTKIVNLYIGGCSLQKHCSNILNDAKLYLYEKDGRSTERYVSIRETLDEEDWDYVVLQQASHDSGIEETFYPYIIDLFNYIKENTKKAEIILHETWAYEIESSHKFFYRYNNSQKEMYEKLSKAYKMAAERLGVRIIPCGDVIQEIRTREPFIFEKGGRSLCRDGYHMDYLYGRYALGATWYETIFNKNILENKYMPKTELAPSSIAHQDIIDIIKKCVHEVK